MIVDSWRSWLVASGVSSGTVRLRVWQLGRLATVFPDGPDSVSLSALLSWMADQRWSRETRRSFVSGVSSAWRWLAKNGFVDGAVLEGLPSVSPASPVPRPAPEWVVRSALLSAASDESLRMMIVLAAVFGLRRAEIAVVRSTDVFGEPGSFVLRVVGKGSRGRLVPLTDDVADWLLSRGGWAFPGRVDGHVSPGWVGKKVARVLPGGFTAHTLRHRCATQAWLKTGDLLVVQRLLGHASPETTSRYVAMPQEALRSAISHPIQN